jgi:trimeric autotransporter adhesin
MCTLRSLLINYYHNSYYLYMHSDIIKAVIARASALLEVSDPTLQQRGALAGLLHLLLLLLNCIPGTRHLLVEADLHSKLVAMVCSFPATAASDGSAAQQPWPAYLACALLLLDLLAQPLVKQDKPDAATAAATAAAELTAGSSEEGVEESKSSEPTDTAAAASSSSAEATAAASAAAAGSSSGSETAAQAAASGGDSMDTDTPEVPPAPAAAASDATTSTTAATDGTAAADAKTAAKPAVAAAVAPVRPPELASELTSEQALALTAHIAEMLKAVAGPAPALRSPSPALTHALLHLLARLLRSADCAAAFVAVGGAPALLALPAAAAFEGRVALIAVILRHLLEDPVTLQAAMETEIRSSYQRMLRASREGRTAGFGFHSVPVGNGRRESVVRLLPLLNLLTPLIARDRDVFMRAAAATLVVHDVTNVAGTGAGRSHVALRPAGQHAAAAAASTAATAVLPPVTPRAASGASHDAMDEVTDTSAAAAEPGSSSGTTAAAAVPAATATASAAATGSKSTGKGKGKARDKHHHGHHHDGAAAAAGGAGACVRDTVMGLLLTALLTPTAAAAPATAAPATAAVVPTEQWLSSENLLVCLTVLTVLRSSCLSTSSVLL